MRPVVILDLAADWTPRNLEDAARVATLPATFENVVRVVHARNEERLGRDPLEEEEPTR